MTHDLVIIGGGPAGVAGGVYAARKCLRTVLITPEFGGQSNVSEGIENWIGTPKLSGAELAKALKSHLEALAGDKVAVVVDSVTSLSKSGERFKVGTKSGKEFEAKAILVASGAGRRKLNVPGAEKFENKGVVYCASCDGPLFAGMDVAVVGGGNAGLETAAQLLAYAKSVTLLHRHPELKADPVTVEKVLAHPNMKAILNVEPTEVKGDAFVSGLTYKNRTTNETGELSVGGVFVEIGVLPNTDFAKGLLPLDPFNRVIADPKNQRTSVEGVWAAGDATDELYHQNNIAAGDAVKALEDIYLWLKMH